MPKLIFDNGQDMIEDLQSIIIEQKNYYEILYSSKDSMINDNHKLTFFNYQNPYPNKLTDVDRKQMGGDITEHEQSN